MDWARSSSRCGQRYTCSIVNFWYEIFWSQSSYRVCILVIHDNTHLITRPFYSDTSLENLELLTAEQTIGDISSFVRFIREYLGNNEYSAVILWGSGFGGSLAVWARKRFPTIINAAYASSGYFILEAYTYSRVWKSNTKLIFKHNVPL